jgi:hypothetical protein
VGEGTGGGSDILSFIVWRCDIVCRFLDAWNGCLDLEEGICAMSNDTLSDCTGCRESCAWR